MKSLFRRGGNMEVICVLIAVIIVLVSIIIGYKREFRRINNEIVNNLDDYLNIKTKSVDKWMNRLLYISQRYANCSTAVTFVR